MKHLDFDDIIKFVSIEKLTKENIELAGKVNGHISECQECFNVVRSCQMIYDELSTRNDGVNMVSLLREIAVNSMESANNTDDCQGIVEK